MACLAVAGTGTPGEGSGGLTKGSYAFCVEGSDGYVRVRGRLRHDRGGVNYHPARGLHIQHWTCRTEASRQALALTLNRPSPSTRA